MLKKYGIIEFSAAEMDFEAAGRERSHDAACGAIVNNELTDTDCEISSGRRSGVQKQVQTWR